VRSALVVVEHRGGHLVPGGLEALGAALFLTERIGLSVQAVLFGAGADVDASVEELLARGAHGVDVFDDPELARSSCDRRVAALGEVIAERQPDSLLFAASSASQDVAACLGARLGAGVVSECVGLEPDAHGRVVAQRAAYGGRIVETVVCTGALQILLLRPGAFVSSCGPRQAAALVVRRTVPRLGPGRPTLIGQRTTRGKDGATSGPDLAEARVVVSAGRGLGSAAALGEVEGLAAALDAAVGAARAVVDAGWMEHTQQVGQTGRNVAPELYIACGISGALQHLAGMSGARLVIAINRDPEAAIFRAADYGIVGDVHEILPRLRDALLAAHPASD
jgi:electron transfer flavoprotein alpha subunit